jgi:spore coat polysaccharide biosynthesis protein SpsF (cytidylyltransferase family)
MASEIMDLRQFVNDQSSPDKQTEKEVVREDFLKFVSESREWAFDYIEEVQSALIKFDTDIKKDLEYFEKFGDVLGDSNPNYVMLKRMYDSYKELKQVLPKDFHA